MILDDELTGDGGSEHGEGEADGCRDEGRRGADRHGRAERAAGDLEEWGTWGGGGGEPEAGGCSFSSTGTRRSERRVTVVGLATLAKSKWAV